MKKRICFILAAVILAGTLAGCIQVRWRFNSRESGSNSDQAIVISGDFMYDVVFDPEQYRSAKEMAIQTIQEYTAERQNEEMTLYDSNYEFGDSTGISYTRTYFENLQGNDIILTFQNDNQAIIEVSGQLYDDDFFWLQSVLDYWCGKLELSKQYSLDEISQGVQDGEYYLTSDIEDGYFTINCY